MNSCCDPFFSFVPFLLEIFGQHPFYLLLYKSELSIALYLLGKLKFHVIYLYLTLMHEFCSLPTFHLPWMNEHLNLDIPSFLHYEMLPT